MLQGDAPIPDCPHVKILHTNKTDVYVHKFGGWALSFVVKHEIGHLALALKDAGVSLSPRPVSLYPYIRIATACY